MRVRLTQLEDGSVLGFTFCHALFDGTRWPDFAAHLAARYVAAVGGAAPPKEALLRPCDRRLLSVEHMRAQLLGCGALLCHCWGGGGCKDAGGRGAAGWFGSTSLGAA